MDKAELEKQLNALIARLDGIIAKLKAIRNYRYDNMCTDFLRSLHAERAKIFADWEKLLNAPAATFSSFDLDAYCGKETRVMDGFDGTMDYLLSRPPIKNPY